MFVEINLPDEKDEKQKPFQEDKKNPGKVKKSYKKIKRGLQGNKVTSQFFPPKGDVATNITLILAVIIMFLMARVVLGALAAPGGTIFAIFILILFSLIAGQIVLQFAALITKLVGVDIKIPQLLGMMAVGITLKNVPYSYGEFESPECMNRSLSIHDHHDIDVNSTDFIEELSEFNIDRKDIHIHHQHDVVVKNLKNIYNINFHEEKSLHSANHPKLNPTHTGDTNANNPYHMEEVQTVFKEEIEPDHNEDNPYYKHDKEEDEPKENEEEINQKGLDNHSLNRENKEKATQYQADYAVVQSIHSKEDVEHQETVQNEDVIQDPINENVQNEKNHNLNNGNKEAVSPIPANDKVHIENNQDLNHGNKEAKIQDISNEKIHIENNSGNEEAVSPSPSNDKDQNETNQNLNPGNKEEVIQDPENDSIIHTIQIIGVENQDIGNNQHFNCNQNETEIQVPDSHAKVNTIHKEVEQELELDVEHVQVLEDVPELERVISKQESDLDQHDKNTTEINEDIHDDSSIHNRKRRSGGHGEPVVYIDPCLNRFIGNDLNPLLTRTLRSICLTVILLTAGLELDPPALWRLKWIVLRTTFIPCIIEAFSASLFCYLILGFPFSVGLCFGFVLCGVSPAIIIPGLVNLSQRGYGVKKGIPTLVIATCSADDLVAIGGFGIALSITYNPDAPILSLAFHGPSEVAMGIAFGIFWGYLCQWFPSKQNPNCVLFRFIIIFCGGLFALFGAHLIHYDGAGGLACVIMAFVASIQWRREGWGDHNPRIK